MSFNVLESIDQEIDGKLLETMGTVIKPDCPHCGGLTLPAVLGNACLGCGAGRVVEPGKGSRSFCPSAYRMLVIAAATDGIVPTVTLNLLYSRAQLERSLKQAVSFDTQAVAVADLSDQAQAQAQAQGTIAVHQVKSSTVEAVPTLAFYSWLGFKRFVFDIKADERLLIPAVEQDQTPAVEHGQVPQQS